MKQLIILIATVFALQACQTSASGSVESKSPDGNILLKAEGKRPGVLEPFNVNLTADAEGLKGNISFEFYAADLNDKTVSYAWEGNDKCTITFMQQDDSKRVFVFTPRSNEAMWTEVK